MPGITGLVTKASRGHFTKTMNPTTITLLKQAIEKLHDHAQTLDNAQYGSMEHRIVWERFVQLKGHILETLSNEATTPRLLLFAGTGQTSGGWLDFKGAFHTRDEAMARVVQSCYEWWHIVDAETHTTVFHSESDNQPLTGI